MQVRNISAVLVLALAGCTTSRQSNDPELARHEGERAEWNAKVEQLSQRVAKLENAQSNAPPTSQTIDAISWRSGNYGRNDKRPILCRLPDWPGWAKLHKFASWADSRFYLEADGREAVPATMGTGGIANEDGSERYILLTPDAPLASGVEYRLRPRNDHATFKWSVPRGVTIVAN